MAALHWPEESLVRPCAILASLIACVAGAAPNSGQTSPSVMEIGKKNVSCPHHPALSAFLVNSTLCSSVDSTREFRGNGPQSANGTAAMEYTAQGSGADGSFSDTVHIDRGLHLVHARSSRSQHRSSTHPHPDPAGFHAGLPLTCLFLVGSYVPELSSRDLREMLCSTD